MTITPPKPISYSSNDSSNCSSDNSYLNDTIDHNRPKPIPFSENISSDLNSQSVSSKSTYSNSNYTEADNESDINTSNSNDSIKSSSPLNNNDILKSKSINTQKIQNIQNNKKIPKNIKISKEINIDNTNSNNILSKLPEPVLVPKYIPSEISLSTLPALKKEVIKLRDEIMKRNVIEKKLNVFIKIYLEL